MLIGGKRKKERSAGAVVADTRQGRTDAASPRTAYGARIEELKRDAAELARKETLLGNARVGVFLLAVLVAVAAFGLKWLSAWWLAPLLLVLVVVFVWYDRVARKLYRAGRAVAFYQLGLARLEENWPGRGQQGQRFADEKHPYAADLDLFGRGSLFELLCTARTRTGEDTLAAWLLHPARAEEVRARQEAVAELRPQLKLREDLALLGADVPAGVDYEGLARWGETEPTLRSLPLRLLCLVVGLAAVTTCVGWLLLDWGTLPLLITLLIESSLAGTLFQRVQAVLKAVEKRGRDLALLANVLEALEQARFTTPRLRELQIPLSNGTDTVASQRIAALGNLIDLLESRRNQLFAPLAYLLMWGTQMAFSIENWRAHSGKSIAAWLKAVGQFEALCALAAYGYEHPDDPFPEVVEGSVCYDGEGLGHPLLPADRCVRNDLRLVDGLRVLVVSGSNMSGKSTYLRTAGVNAVLALAGAPVRARRLRLTPLAVGATLRIQDSLQEGRSRFFAEVLRVRQVVELTRGPLPLLFLLDEIFAGTNSHDRRIGAEAVVRGLVEAGAVGLVTTHDLSLTQIADQLGQRSTNVHFADHFENGEMRFDYRLQPGVVQHSNALALMRAVGLRV
jgi:hypothetical protein